MNPRDSVILIVRALLFSFVVAFAGGSKSELRKRSRYQGRRRCLSCGARIA
jgi:hypothetical protein